MKKNRRGTVTFLILRNVSVQQTAMFYLSYSVGREIWLGPSNLYNRTLRTHVCSKILSSDFYPEGTIFTSNAPAAICSSDPPTVKSSYKCLYTCASQCLTQDIRHSICDDVITPMCSFPCPERMPITFTLLFGLFRHPILCLGVCTIWLKIQTSRKLCTRE